MTRQELINRIKSREANYSEFGAFHVAEVVELAEGILAVREADGDSAIRFDNSKYKVFRPALKDQGPFIRNPLNSGFIDGFPPIAWHNMKELAQTFLKKKVGRGKIEWHDEPISVKY